LNGFLLSKTKTSPYPFLKGYVEQTGRGKMLGVCCVPPQHTPFYCYGGKELSRFFIAIVLFIGYTLVIE
jgi:hypothetical protein